MMVMFRHILAYLVMVLILASGIAKAGTVYVDDDNTAGPWEGTEANPFQYIQDGINASFDGDTVLVANGLYTGTGNVNLDFNGKAITVKSENGPDNCIIDCESVTDTRGFYFHRGEGPDSVVSGFTIRNGNIQARYSHGSGICCISSSPTITGNIITDNVGEGSYSGAGGGIYCESSSPVIARNYIIGNTGTSGGGIYCKSSSPLIVNNLIMGNKGGGINCNYSSSSPLIVNNTITGNISGYALKIERNSSATVVNTILWDNPEEIYVNPSSTVTVSHSDVRYGEAGITGGGTVNWGTANISLYPALVDPANGDCHLDDVSPCIGAGTSWFDYNGNGIMDPGEATPNIDIEGNPRPRPSGSMPDMGAYERELGEPAALPNVWMEIIGSDQIRVGRAQQYRVVVTNDSQYDAPYVLVNLTYADSPSVKVECENVEYPSQSMISWEEIDPSCHYNGKRIIPLILKGLPAGESAELYTTVLLSHQIGNINLSVENVPLSLHEFLSQQQRVSEAMRTGILSEPDSFPNELLDLASQPNNWWNEYLKALQDFGLVPPDLSSDAKYILAGWSDTRGINWEDVKVWAEVGLIAVGLIVAFAPPAWISTAAAVSIARIWAVAAIDAWIFNYTWDQINKRLEAVIVKDPNDKAGPNGYDPDGTIIIERKHYIKENRSMYYMIFFENLETATAAAQEVLITDQFDTNLDWNSFSLGEMKIGDEFVSVPEGQQSFSTVVDLRPELPTLAELDCQYDSVTGLAQWLIRGVDPDTGELADLLPPNTDAVAPLGEGWVSYRVNQNPDLSTGTVIRNVATIDFEVDIPPEPMNTPEFVNTIDSGVPSSQVNPLPTGVPDTFTVEWAGTDDENGSGIKDYSIYVSDDGGSTFIVWLSYTTQVSAQFAGELLHTYYFYSRARDNVGNVEAPPSGPDAVTTVVSGALTGLEIGLGESWNLISLPLQPQETGPGEVLSSIAGLYNSVWAYEPDNGWSIYAPGAPSNLQEMVPGEGYWIKMNEPGDLTIEGAIPDQTSVFLQGNAWNLVGYTPLEPYLEPKNAEECMRSVENDINSVWEYGPHDAVVEAKSWSIYSPGGPSDLETMKPGYGYWIKADQDCWWNVNAPAALSAPLLAVGPRRVDVSRDRPGIPYRVWGRVEVDGVDMTEKSNCVVSLKVGNKVQSSCELGATSVYGDFYVLDVPISSDGLSQELYVQIDGSIIKASVLPPAEPGQILRLDLSVRLQPEVSLLHQNYPNPFNPDTWIPYQLKEQAQVKVRIYASTGQLVRTLNLGHKPAGFYTSKDKAAYWDGRNEAGESVASGVYFYSVQAGSFTDTRKMAILK